MLANTACLPACPPARLPACLPCRGSGQVGASNADLLSQCQQAWYAAIPADPDLAPAWQVGIYAQMLLSLLPRRCRPDHKHAQGRTHAHTHTQHAVAAHGLNEGPPDGCHACAAT